LGREGGGDPSLTKEPFSKGEREIKKRVLVPNQTGRGKEGTTSSLFWWGARRPNLLSRKIRGLSPLGRLKRGPHEAEGGNAP